MYDSILLPLDGSTFAEAAIPLAVALSAQTGATVRLVTVVEHFPASDSYGWQDALRDQAQEYLEEVAESVRPRTGREVTTSVLLGHVSSVLETQAEDADLVVMASHGRGGLSRAWLGSAADDCVRHGKKPVLLVRPDDAGGGAPDADWSVRKMLLPLDGGQVSEAILDHAVELGSLFGATYHLVRVVPSPKQFNSPYPPHMIQANRDRMHREEEEARAYLEAHGQRLRDRGFTVEERVITGVQPAHGILREAEATGCDFIAISAHGRGLLAKAVLGSTSDKVVRAAHLPLLLYRASD